MTEMEKLSPNQMIRKKRTTRYFIDAAEKIAREKGLKGITIRNVADLAGYNSATIYNYFENVEELIALTAIDMVQPWITSGSRIYRENEDVLDQYIGGWKSFCEYAFRDPEGFAFIYSEQPEGIGRHFRTYGQLFGEGEEESIYRGLYEQESLVEQEENVIQPCVEAGYFRAEDAASIYEYALLLFDALIGRVLRNRQEDRAEEYTRLFLEYFLEYIKARLRKKANLDLFLK